jgi:hypothetical protein
MIRRLLPLLGVVIALIPGAQSAKATTQGLTVIGYTITETPPSLDLSTLTECGRETPEFINIVFEYDPIGQCGDELFLAHYQGFVTLPQGTETVRFWLASDDGGMMKIAGQQWGQWTDQGCSAYETDEITTLPAGVPLTLEGHYYEAGGGTCFMLAWSLNGEQLTIIPPSAFTTTGATTPTTTTTSSSTTSTTSTTSTSTTSTSTTTTVAPTTTTTPATTSTTEAPQTTTTATTSTTSTTTTVAQAAATTSTIVSVSTSSDPTTSTSPQTTTPPSTTTSNPSTTTIAPEPPKPVYTKAEAVNIATDPAQVAQLSAVQAEAVFETLNIEELTVEQADAVIAAVQDAPVAVREALEDKINIFGGAADKYIPIGSTVPVSTRRVVIITTGLLVSMPTIRRR